MRLLKIINIKSLDNEEILKTEQEPEEVVYGIPEMLTVKKQDNKIVFLLWGKSNIEVKHYDVDGNLLSRKKYTTTAEQMKSMYVLLGLADKQPV